jgi:hypothetical protein
MLAAFSHSGIVGPTLSSYKGWMDISQSAQCLLLRVSGDGIVRTDQMTETMNSKCNMRKRAEERHGLFTISPKGTGEILVTLDLPTHREGTR